MGREGEKMGGRTADRSVGAAWHARQPRAGGGERLQGEKIDIIQWSRTCDFVVNAARGGLKVVLDEEAERIEVVVPDEQLSLASAAVARTCAASQLTGWDIDIMTEAEESERRQKEFAARTELFVAGAGCRRDAGQLLASEGFATVEEVAYVDLARSPRSRASTSRRRKSCRTGARVPGRARPPSWTRAASNWACSTS